MNPVGEEFDLSHTIRSCRADELPQLGALANSIFRARRPGDMVTEYPLLFAEENLEQLRVISVDGQIVAHVGILLRDILILGCRARTAAIGSVCTHPDFRGHGLASKLMADARQHAIDHGASLMLISGTRGLYRRLGYVEVGSFRRVTVQSKDVGEPIEIDLFRHGHLQATISLHQQEPVRFLRPREDWERLIAAGMIMNQPADMYVLRRASHAVAYVAVRRPSRSDAVPEVVEFGGSRTAISHALPQLAGPHGSPVVSVIVRGDDPGWGWQLAGRSFTSTAIPFDGTVGILDVERFLGAIRPVLEERVGTVDFDAEADSLTVRHGGDTYRLESSANVTAFLFGGCWSMERRPRLAWSCQLTARCSRRQASWVRANSNVSSRTGESCLRPSKRPTVSGMWRL